MDRPGSAKSRPRIGRAGDLDIVFEDDDLIVVNKPAGLLSVPLERKTDVPSVYEQIEDRFRSHGKRRPFVVHRIDQDTSGLVVFAKGAEAQKRLKAQFARREPDRVYLAVVYGHPDPIFRHLARHTGLGHEGAHSEGNASPRPEWNRSDLGVPRRRILS